MFSFDLSTVNILLIVGVISLFTLFIIVLMKLNPSTATKEDREGDALHIKEVELEKQKPLQIEQNVPRPVPEVKETIPVTVERALEKPLEKPFEKPLEKPLVAVNTYVGRPSIPTDQESKTSILSRPKEVVVSKPPVIVAPKAENNHPSRRDCLHQFGYLRTLPKNAPIPDECFGCLKVVECLVKAKTKEG